MTPKARALVDSGCSSTTFPAEWAATLGIDWEECTPIPGITASGADDAEDQTLWPRVWAPGVDAILMGEKVHLSAMFRIVQVGTVPILLGRDDFFAHYRVSFEHRDRRFFLEPY